MHDNITIPKDSALYEACLAMVEQRRIIFLAGLPGVGKSLLLQQLALLAHGRGRIVHLLQWDVARQPFETHPMVLEQYPEVEGMTHPVVRKAVGLWARHRVTQWHQQHRDRDRKHLLIGEVPLVGNRLIELAQAWGDDIEALLSGSDTIFAVPVPSRELRRLIEARREASHANPQHEREQADAIPAVMRDLWLEVYRVAQHFGLIGMVPKGASLVYDPDIYAGVYEGVLKRRQSQVWALDMLLEPKTQSAHNLDIQAGEFIPQAEDVECYLAEVAQRYPDTQQLAQEMETWFVV